MKLADMASLFDKGHRRWHMVGSDDAGVAVGLDLEGRLFAVIQGHVLNRVNPEAFLKTSTSAAYINPGGDGLWPAPEGSTLGYQYSTPAWRVPPGLTSARYVVLQSSPTAAVVRAEVDLINARGVGVPTAFERHIQVTRTAAGSNVQVTEIIEYLGRRPLRSEDALLVPWTLCQFDSGPGSFVCFPDAGPASVWDLYETSDARRTTDGRMVRTCTAGGPRYQLGLSPAVGWIEYRNPSVGLVVHRTASPMPGHSPHVDIADRDPESPPTERPVRFSVYSDPSMFMEIEAAGGCPEILHPGTRIELAVSTNYSLK